VGREREQRRLSALLDAALTGHGGLTLVSGEAGIGKTALVRDIAALATERGYLVLTGDCYDSGTTPAYSLWRDLLSVAVQRNLPIPSLPANDDWVAQAATPEAVVTTLRDALDNLVERGPLLVILEDLHWADPESLAFLRLFARGLSEQRLLLVATYRDTELPVDTPLDQTLPHLIHEANVERIALHPLDEPAIEALIRQRYALPAADQVRLTASLAGRSQGVPFYLIELLSTLEADQSLRRTTDGWLLGELAQHLVPVLVKQVIDARLSGLGNDARRLLELVAVINQEAPLVLLRRLNGLDDDTFADALDEAMRSQLLITGTSSLCVQYTHALARDSLYAGIPLSRRQRWHRQIAEALAEDGGHPPDVIAHHFRKALDRRAVEWFIRAGSAVERVAWLTAASHFAAALEMLGPNEGDPQLRGWLLARRAGPLRNTEPRTSLALLATAEALAIETNDAVLYLYVTFLRGQIRCISGDIQRGLVDLETSVSALAGLSPADIERFEELEGRGAVASRIEIEGLLAAMLASVGRVDEALEGAEKIIRRANVTPVRAWWARAIALALAGRPSEASGAFFACGEALRRALEASTGATLILYQIMLLQIPYAADDLVERRRIVADGEMAWQYAGGALGEVSRPLIALQYLLIEGDWQTARELAALGIETADLTSVKHLIAGIVLARIAREQGETTLAWQLVHRILPAGPQTAPGHAEFATSRALMFTATLLSLDAGDIPSARTWLDAHDQWLKWNRTVLGQSENQLLWAQFYRAMGDLSRARRHATESLGLASDPRQPLALLASHRLCGELEATSGALSKARRHLDAALSLADACAARYERALTLLAIADLERRAGKPDAASATLSEAHSIFRELKATPVLARAEALAAELAGQQNDEPAAGFGLSPREIEVLRLIANGGRNREIAEELFLSVRTVERHIANLYLKLGVSGRSEAIAFAHAHNIR
jgi:DNA-binding CsgD family transcriptional regulator/type II secretory pathway predicted ATPase ExeA